MFVSAGYDLKFHKWPSENSDFIYVPHASTNVTAVSWSKDNEFLTLMSENSQPEIVTLKDMNKIKNIHTITAVNDVSTIAFQRTSRRSVGMGTVSGQVVLYDIRNKSISKLLPCVASSVNLVDFNANDKYMSVSSVKGVISLYDVKHGCIRGTYSVSSNSTTTALRYHPTEKYLLTVGLEDGTVIQLDTYLGQKKFCEQVHTSSVTGLAMIKNSELLITVGHDHKFCIYDLSINECTYRCNQPFPLSAVDVNYDGNTVAIGSKFGDVYVYDMRRLTLPVTIAKPHNTKINRILFENKLNREFLCESDDASLPSSIRIRRKGHEGTLIADDCQQNPTKISIENNEQSTEMGGATTTASSFLIKIAPDNEPNCLPEKEWDRDTANAIRSVRKEVLQSIQRGADELRMQFMEQINGLNNLITSEFRDMSRQLDRRWDIHELPPISQSKYHGEDADFLYPSDY